jgi:hypothetical protein
MAAPRRGLPFRVQRRLPRVSSFRGSMARPVHWLSTLRSPGRPGATQDSLPAAGQALPGGGRCPAGFQREVSAIQSLPPLPSFPGAHFERIVTNPQTSVAHDGFRGGGQVDEISSASNPRQLNRQDAEGRQEDAEKMPREEENPSDSLSRSDSSSSSATLASWRFNSSDFRFED